MRKTSPVIRSNTPSLRSPLLSKKPVSSSTSTSTTRLLSSTSLPSYYHNSILYSLNQQVQCNLRNGVFEGTDSCKYPFKVIHYELGIPCRFHDFRDTHATRLIEAGADIKAVSKRLGHSNIRTTYEIYVRVTDKMERVTANLFDEVATL